MASPEVILELLKQAEAARNKPSNMEQILPALMQVMAGVQQGIQLYDSAQGVKAKYGTDVKTPAVPAGPDTVIPAATGNLTAGTFDTRAAVPGFSWMNQPAAPTVSVPGSSAMPETVTHTPGTVDIGKGKDMLDALKNFSGAGVDEGAKKALDLFGIKNPGDVSVAPGMITTFDASGRPIFTQAPTAAKNIKMAPSAQNQADILELRKQQLQLSKDQFAQSISQFNSTLANAKDQKDADRIKAMSEPFLKVLTDKKFANDQDAINYANTSIQILNDTGTIPDTRFEQASKFGIEIPTFLWKGKKVAEPRGKGKGAVPTTGKIKVRRKSDGQAGEINEADFDETKYEKM